MYILYVQLSVFSACLASWILWWIAHLRSNLPWISRPWQSFCQSNWHPKGELRGLQVRGGASIIFIICIGLKKSRFAPWNRCERNQKLRTILMILCPQTKSLNDWYKIQVCGRYKAFILLSICTVLLKYVKTCKAKKPLRRSELFLFKHRNLDRDQRNFLLRTSEK